MDSNHRPHAYQACALTSWAIDPCGGGKGIRTLDPLRARQVLSQLSYTPTILLNNLMIAQNWTEIKTISFEYEVSILLLHFSIERRWSSRRFSYGYLVTTSPQSLALPSTAASYNVSSQASGISNSHGVTGGVYKARERIHRDILIRDY